MKRARQEGIRLFVYALCEPDTGEVRYVGLTANVWKRLLRHYRGVGCPRVQEWIDQLKARSIPPSIKVIRSVIGIEAGVIAEEEEIKAHASDKLLNEKIAKEGGGHRPVRMIRFGGKKMTATAWAKELGITRQALCIRLNSHPVKVALSRGKSPHKPLEQRRLRSFKCGSETVTVDLPPNVGLTHFERRKRRREMVRLFDAGMLVKEIAAHFGVTTATVNQAIREHKPRMFSKTG